MEELLENDKKQSRKPLTTTGVALLALSGTTFVGVCALTVPFLSPALRRFCLPYVPATTQQVRNVFTALEGKSGTLLDIGSGDGRIVLDAAKQGFSSSGVELNVWLVLFSKYRAWKTGLSHNAKFHRQDLWKTDLKNYDNIVIFGVEQMMAPLEKKFQHELSVESNIVACRFPLPTWKPSRAVGTGIDTVWLYRKL